MAASSPPPDHAAALLRANRRRRSIRRWVTIGTLPLTIGALFLAGKLLSMYAFAHQAITAYVVDDHAGAAMAARGQELFNAFEPYVAPFNVGTALGAADHLPEARVKLEEALDLATGFEVCDVRINLALVVERMGDAARADGDGAAAAQFFDEALTLVVETPDECDSDEEQQQSSDPERDMAESLDSAEERLTRKQQEQQPEDPAPEEQAPEEQQPEEPQPSEEKLQDLRDRLDQGTQERDELPGDEPGGGGTDKPW